MDRLSRALHVPIFAGVVALCALPVTDADAAPAPVQRPKQLDREKTADPQPPAEQEPAPAAPTADEAPAEGATQPGAGGEIAPEAPSDAQPTEEIPEPEGRSTTHIPLAVPAPEAEPGTDEPRLLAPSEEDQQPKASPRRVLSDEEKQEREAAALARAFREQYRPANNPTRFNLSVRGMFTASATLDATVGGRMGGASLDAGVTWNHVGVAATATALGGRIVLPPDKGTEIRTLVGGGPTVSMGRLALIRRGFLDLRVGYDFYYGPVREQSGGSTLKPQDDDPDADVVVDTTDLIPHGFRVRLDMGLLANPQVPRRFWHGFGLGIGYQGLVGSIRGDLPYTSMLTMGLVYWMG